MEVSEVLVLYALFSRAPLSRTPWMDKVGCPFYLVLDVNWTDLQVGDNIRSSALVSLDSSKCTYRPRRRLVPAESGPMEGIEFSGIMWSFY